MKNYQAIKKQICDVCHKTCQLGRVAANDGNVSARPSGAAGFAVDYRQLQTPWGNCKTRIKAGSFSPGWGRQKSMNPTIRHCGRKLISNSNNHW